MPRRRSTAVARASRWGGRKAQSIRATMRPMVEAGEVCCPFCQRLIQPWEPWDVDHAIPLDVSPETKWDVSLMRPAHASCNRRAGQALVTRKRAQGLVPRRPSVLCAGCAAVWVDPAQWLCRECALVVSGA